MVSSKSWPSICASDILLCPISCVKDVQTPKFIQVTSQLSCCFWNMLWNDRGMLALLDKYTWGDSPA